MLGRSGVFRKYLISYLVILCIPSIAGYMSYRTSISVMTNVSIENSVGQLQKSRELLERRMAEVEGFTRQLAINQDLGVLMTEPASGDKPNLYGIWKMMREVTTVGQTNDFLRHFFIYLRNYNVVLAPGSASFRPEHYYDSYSYADMTFEEWKQSVLDSAHHSELMPLRPYVANRTESSVITYMQSLPLDSFAEASPAVVVVLIDGRMIASHLTGITDRYGGWVHIADEHGRTIGLQGIGEPDVAALAADPRFDGSKTSQFFDGDLVITIRSDRNGWVYQAGIPRHALLQNANHIRLITWTVTGIALLIGLVAGLLLAYRNSAPINRLLGVFGHEARTGRNEYDFLQGNIAEMISSNKRLEAELRRQQPMVRDAFYKRLVAGEFRTRDELVAAAVQANAGLSGNAGYAAIVQVNGYSGMDNVEVLNELNASRLVLKQTMRALAGPVAMTELGSDRIVILFVSEEGSADDYTEQQVDALLRQLAQSLFDEFKISVLAAVGNRFVAVTDISQSFEQAKQALEHVVLPGDKSVVWYGRSILESATYYYPLDVELRLIGTIRAGELAEAQRIVQMIVTQNSEQRELSAEMRNQLALELKGTLLKLLDQKAFAESDAFEMVKNRVVAMQAPETLAALRQELDEIIEAMCGIAASRKNDMHIRLVEQIRQFIDRQYADSDLTLYRVAEQVGRPEKYISQLFKEVTGTNLSDHLEQVRMAHAGQLLRDNRITIDEIASRVGYNSSHSFRRAFKRVTGVSPSAYRQSL